MREYTIAAPIQAGVRAVIDALRLLGDNMHADWLEYCLKGWKEAEERVWDLEAFLFEQKMFNEFAKWKHGAE